MENMIKFDSPKDKSSIIKVLGVGGGGSNAVNYMYQNGIQGVNFIVCNTDAQDLDRSPVPERIQLGANLTHGLGAGANPEVGENAAIESIEDIKAALSKGTKMIFVTACMGGGTGTGGAPVIAAAAKEMGILTIAIVTIPFSFEGRKKMLVAEEGIRKLRESVDSLLIISNDRLRQIYGNLGARESFAKADGILTTAAKGIAELITVPGYINVDFEDVRTVMKNSGVALMGTGIAEGENRAIKAIEMALSSPLLNDNSIRGAKNFLMFITCSHDNDVTMDELSEITEYIQGEAGQETNMIWGMGYDDNMEGKLGITIVATGFECSDNLHITPGLTSSAQKTITHVLEYGNETEKLVVPDPVAETKTASAPQQEIKRTFEFVVNSDIKPEPEPATEYSEPELELSVKTAPVENKQSLSPGEEVKTNLGLPENRSRDRIAQLKRLSYLQTPEGLRNAEMVPAYVRRDVKLSDTLPASESVVSRYTLAEGEDKKGEIKTNNSFLHDAVD